MSVFEKLKGSRLYDELLMLFKETAPHNSIKIMKEYGLVKVIHPVLEEKDPYNSLAKAYDTIKGIDILFLKEDYKKELVYLMVIMWDLNPSERNELLDKIFCPSHIKKKLLEDIETAKNTLSILDPEDNVKIYKLLKPLNTETLILMLIYAKEKQKKAISFYLTKLKDVRISIKGEDLKRLDIPPGPLYKEIFDAVLEEKLNGKLTSREEEVEFAKNFYKLKQHKLNENA